MAHGRRRRAADAIVSALKSINYKAVSMLRVLVLQSVHDEIARLRERRLLHSPLLQEYSFRHVYAIEWSQAQKITPLQAVQAFRKEELFERVAKEIESFAPHVLIVHAGFVFQRFPEDMFWVLTSLKKKYPFLKIGIEPKMKIRRVPEITSFDNADSRVSWLIKQVFTS